jgi:hypothetical protein
MGRRAGKLSRRETRVPTRSRPVWKVAIFIQRKPLPPPGPRRSVKAANRQNHKNRVAVRIRVLDK